MNEIASSEWNAFCNMSASMGVRHYKELFAWQLGEELKREVYRILRSSTEAWRDYGYRRQVVEAMRSVPANVAEGFRRCSPADFMRFLDYSMGSLGETETHLLDGIDQGYFAADDCQKAFRLAARCGKACNRLKQSQARYLEERKARQRKPNRNRQT